MRQLTVNELIKQLQTCVDVMDCGDDFVAIYTDDEPHFKSVLSVCTPTLYIDSPDIDKDQPILMIKAEIIPEFEWTTPISSIDNES